MDLQELANRLRAATVEAQEEMYAALIRKHEAEVVDLNIAQMNAGQYNDGSMIEPAYTERTVEIKKAKGQRSDVVTLNDEGIFQSKMYLEGRGFPYEINSSDLKTGLLDEKYDADKFFGLQETNKAKVSQDLIKEEAVEYYRGLVGL